MPEPIPLGTRLGIERQHIIIHEPRRLVDQFLDERFPIKAGMSHTVEW